MLALLGLTGERETLIALKMAQQIARYQPAVAKLSADRRRRGGGNPGLEPVGGQLRARGRADGVFGLMASLNVEKVRELMGSAAEFLEVSDTGDPHVTAAADRIRFYAESVEADELEVYEN